MSARRSRMSLGPGGSLAPLGDASSRANRRTSFGGVNNNISNGNGNDDGNSDNSSMKKDRRAMLEEWRRNRGATATAAASSSFGRPPSSAPTPEIMRSSSSRGLSPIAASPVGGNNNDSSFDQMDHQQQQYNETRSQLKPPSSAPSSSQSTSMDLDQDTSGLSALERYRLRKARQQQQQQDSVASSAGGQGGSASNNYNNNNHDEGIAYAASAAPSSHGTPSRTTTSRLPPTYYGAASSSLSSASSSFADDDDNLTTTVAAGGSSSYSVGTPSRRGKSSRMSLSLGGGAQRRGVKRRTTPGSMEVQQVERKLRPMIPPSYSAPVVNDGELQQQQHHHDDYEATATIGGGGGTIDYQPPPPPSFSQESVESSASTTTATTNNVDGMAMQSRIAAMQRRIENLEREKMDLAMSKAPLEARIRQKEDAWVKERERLLREINNFQDLARETDERYRELEMKNEALEEETMKLRLEARAANVDGGGGVCGGGSTDSWSERVKSNNEIKELRKEVKSKDDEIRALRIEKMSLESEVFAYQKDIETCHRDYENLEKDFRELEGSQSQNSEAQIQLEVLTTEHTAMTAQLNATCADLEEIKTRAKADLDAKEQQWKNREKELLFEMSVLKSRAGKSADGDDLDMENGEDVNDPAVLKARIEERDRRIAELEEQLLSGEQLRRALHNRIQELRGNIRVFVRTRPFLPNDGAASNSSIDIMPDGESLSIQGKYVGEGHSFKFDKVFAPSAGQGVVFDEVSEFVQSALDGYNVCLFSYGQTGSGKTHTMQGSGNGAMRGIIPRAVEQILQQAALMQSQRWKFTMKASFLEIYNEDLRDLLVMMNSDGSLKQRDTASAPKLSIKRDQDGKSYVDGINKVDIDVEDKAAGLAQLEAVMVAAARARSVATTKMNAQSSRSHSVFMLHLCGSNEESGTIVEGALNLCDLAGSERLDRSGAGSDHKRLKETQAINKSLSSLGDVFTSLANGSKHIPFRNSKLTYLLQDCLSGDGKALMFVNLSPTVESSNESLCSLRFAQRVNAVELGKAVKHVQYSSKGGSGRR